MNRIKVIHPTMGDEPEWVLLAWIGVIMEFYTEISFSDSVSLRTVKNKSIIECPPEGVYAVKISEALSALREKSAAAFQWYNDHVKGEKFNVFIFDKNACELLT